MKLFKNTVYTLLLVMILSVVSPNIIQIPGYVNSVEAATKISKGKATLIKGQTTTLKISGTKKKAKWSTSKKSVAIVNSKGKVTAKGKGTATITAIVGNEKYTCTVDVQTPKINKSKLTITVGNTSSLKINGTDQKITWKTSNKKIATVDKNGNVVGKKSGKVKITATVLKKKYSCTVTVKAKQCKLSATKLDMQVDQLGFLELQNAKGKVTWKSSNNSIVKVSNGILLGIKPGTAKVTATHQKKKYTCTVIVKKMFSEKEALKNVSITTTEEKEAIIFNIKNNYTYRIRPSVEVLFYDANGRVVDMSSDVCECLDPNSKTMLWVWKPYDSNDNIINYAYYECRWEMSDASYNIGHEKITYKSHYGNDNIIIELKNNSMHETFGSLIVVLYYDGLMSRWSTNYIISLNPYSTIYEEIYLPYGDDDLIKKPDRYEIYIS